MITDIHTVINIRAKAEWMNIKTSELKDDHVHIIKSPHEKLEPVNYNAVQYVLEFVSKSSLVKRQYCPDCSHDRREPCYHSTSERSEYLHSIPRPKAEAILKLYELVNY